MNHVNVEDVLTSDAAFVTKNVFERRLIVCAVNEHISVRKANIARIWDPLCRNTGGTVWRTHSSAERTKDASANCGALQFFDYGDVPGTFFIFRRGHRRACLINAHTVALQGVCSAGASVALRGRAPRRRVGACPPSAGCLVRGGTEAQGPFMKSRLGRVRNAELHSTYAFVQHNLVPRPVEYRWPR